MSKKSTQLQVNLLSAIASIAQRSGKLNETMPRGTVVACIFVILIGPTVLLRYLLR